MRLAVGAGLMIVRVEWVKTCCETIFSSAAELLFTVFRRSPLEITHNNTLARASQGASVGQYSLSRR